jgi:propionate CoA-transferase
MNLRFATHAKLVSRLCPLRIRIQSRWNSTRNKIVSADDAVHVIRNGDTVTVGGFVGQSGPEEILSALGRRFKETGYPRDLTLVIGAGPADWKDRGLNHFGHPGMLRRVVGSHYGQSPMISELVQANKIEAYQLPLGSVSRMIRTAAAKLPGHITKIGFGTLADPRFGGGKLNSITKDELVEEIEVPPPHIRNLDAQERV